ncbi:hypothetical protein [Vulcanisaeta souniana]|uniref:hypothetical protein n=1 Tax=Vulcanisaeta souniana TaxID=164452 RepID=UPI001FB26E97|nr:hypothetical protein [Vulcanisaeta souniana]
MAWAFTVGTPGNSPTADQAPPPIFRDLTFVNDVNEGGLQWVQWLLEATIREVGGQLVMGGSF